MARSSLYEITVRIETFDPQERGETPEQFETRPHRFVWLEAAAPDLARHGPAEVWAARVYTAGVIARVALDLQDQVRRAAVEDRHDCRAGDGWGDTCGEVWEELAPVTNFGTCGPYLHLTVPAQHAASWADRARELLAETLISDHPSSMPTPEEDSPHHRVIPDHPRPATPAPQERTVHDR